MATPTQSNYRWRNDDGSETSATWVAAVNTSITGQLDRNYRLRIVTSLAGSGSITIAPKLQYNKNSAGWNDVNTSSNVARSSSSPNVADNTATTGQIIGGNPGRFDSNGTVETTTSLNDAGATDTEHEYCFQIRSADVVTADQIQFRLVTASGGTYSSYGVFGLFIAPTTYTPGQFFAFFE